MTMVKLQLGQHYFNHNLNYSPIYPLFRWRSVMEGECSEGAEGWLLVRIHVPELNVQKSLQFPRDQLIWDVKQQCLAALPKVATWYRVRFCKTTYEL
ncbi:hypothetical protein O3G_MSEX011579 [Manduca sexta]|uniref:Uncharacterized protein n=1 Tax=Manduca sexta TaxID=7130 RepID=A0A921ZL82_MANSE|nr:hypothetical protein O3G_MSEX011579 [Manduca sexta]